MENKVLFMNKSKGKGCVKYNSFHLYCCLFMLIRFFIVFFLFHLYKNTAHFPWKINYCLMIFWVLHSSSVPHLSSSLFVADKFLNNSKKLNENIPILLWFWQNNLIPISVRDIFVEIVVLMEYLSKAWTIYILRLIVHNKGV